MHGHLVALAHVICVQLFWFSLIGIGWMVWLFLQRTVLRRWQVAFFPKYLGLTALVSLAAGFSVMTVGAVLLYALGLPSFVFTTIYLLVLLLALTYALVLMRSAGAARWRSLLKRHSDRRWWLALFVLPLVGCLLMDYVFSLYVGAQLAEGSDSYVHIAKIMTLLHQGFSLDDGFLAGVVESRYHVNSIHALYVIPAQLFHIDPFQVWRWSLAFFRFTQWVAIFALVEFLLRQAFGRTRTTAGRVATVATIVSMAFLSATNFMFVANYPDKVVTLWITLFVLALFMQSEKRTSRIATYLLYMSAFLITFTHPTYALMTAIFFIMFTALRALIVRTNKRRDYISAAITTSLLMVGPVITILFPDRMTVNAFNFGDFQTATVLGTRILRPGLPTQPMHIIIDVLALVGYGALLVRYRQNRTTLLLLSLLTAFYVLTAFDPIFMAVVSKKLPLWLVARFREMNVLAPIGFLLGAYVVGDRLHELLGQRHALRSAVWMTGAVFIVGTLFWVGHDSYHNFYDDTKGIDHGYTAFAARTATDLRTAIPNKALVVANLGDSYFLSAVLPVKVIAIHEAHATPVAATAQRLACQERLLTNLSPADLVATRADYVVIPPWDPRFEKLSAILRAEPYFSYVHRGPDYLVYKVDKQRLPAVTPSPGDPCVRYQRIEQSR